MSKIQDKYHGQGGDFEVDQVTRERRRVGDAPKAEPEGGGARDKDGRPIREKAPAPEPALPAPGRAPWDSDAPAAAGGQPAAAAAPDTKKTKGA